MAKLPEASDLGTVIPRGPRGVVVDRSGMIGAQAIGSTAQALASVANIGIQVREKEDRFNYARAKSMLLQADTELRKSLEEDPDFSTYEQRYTEGMNKAKQEAAGLVRGGYDRQLFDLEANQDVLRGSTTIRDYAKKKETDWGRSTVDTDLEKIRANAITADEATRSKAIDMAKDLIIGAQQRGYYSQEEATNVYQSWRNSAVEGYIESQPAEKQIEILSGKGNVADYLQPDVRAKLLEQAKNVRNEVRIKAESQAQEDAIVAKTRGNWSQALQDARSITDPEIRDATVSRIKTRWSEAKQLDAEAEEAAVEQATAFLNEGGTYENMPLALKNRLKPSTLNSIRNFSENGGAPKKSDQEYMLKIDTLFADDPQAFGEQNPLDWKPYLSQSDWEQREQLWAKVRSGSLDGKDSGFRTTVQLRNQAMTELFKGNDPKTAKKRGIFADDFEARLKAFQEDKGKKATSDEVKKLIDDMTVEVALSGWFSGSKMAYELTDEDIAAEGRGTRIVVPKEDRDMIIPRIRAAGKEVTEDEIIRMYRHANK